MIKQAIIPLAGLGTRMLPLTSVVPKELMPINGKPNLEYILEECLNAGIKEFIFIISKKNFLLKNIFLTTISITRLLRKKDKRIIHEYKKIKKYQKMIKFVYQNTPRGTGDAVFLKCQKLVKNKFFLMLLPDDLIIRNNCSKEMIRLHKITNGSVIATKKSR